MSTTGPPLASRRLHTSDSRWRGPHRSWCRPTSRARGSRPGSAPTWHPVSRRSSVIRVNSVENVKTSTSRSRRWAAWANTRNRSAYLSIDPETSAMMISGRSRLATPLPLHLHQVAGRAHCPVQGPPEVGTSPVAGDPTPGLVGGGVPQHRHHEPASLDELVLIEVGEVAAGETLDRRAPPWSATSISALPPRPPAVGGGALRSRARPDSG